MPRTSQWTVLLGALLLSGGTALIAQGCTVSSGDGDPDFSDGGPIIDSDSGTVDTGTNPPEEVPCNTCLNRQCSGQSSVCFLSAECLAIYQCATAAGADVQGCIDAHPTGAPEYTAFYQCDQAVACSASCSAVCPGLYDCTTPTPVDDAGTGCALNTDTCNACPGQKCATQSAACGSDSECEQYLLCAGACTGDSATPECTGVCEQAHPDGKIAADALNNCAVSNCKAECCYN